MVLIYWRGEIIAQASLLALLQLRASSALAGARLKKPKLLPLEKSPCIRHRRRSIFLPLEPRNISNYLRISPSPPRKKGTFKVRRDSELSLTLVFASSAHLAHVRVKQHARVPRGAEFIIGTFFTKIKQEHVVLLFYFGGEGEILNSLLRLRLL